MSPRGAVERETATRRRLLDVATRLFSERGYSSVTVRDICAEADANLAAINYHFGDKLNLYLEIVRGVLEQFRERQDIVMQAPPNASAKQRLLHYVRGHFEGYEKHRSEKGYEHTARRLFMNEMHQPTAAAELIAEQAFRPRLRYLSVIVAELLGEARDEERVQHCAASIQGLLMARLALPMRRMMFDLPKSSAAREGLIQDIYEFSLAGIRALRSRRKRAVQL